MTQANTPPQQPRMFGADALKALAIFAVVFIHTKSLIPFVQSYTRYIAQAGRFCVPVFVIVWAYFLEKSFAQKKDRNSYLFKRFTRLAIPFLFWTAIYTLITYFYGGLSLLQFINKFWLGYGWSGQYYFIILFQLLLIFPLVRTIDIQLIRHRVLTILILAASYLVISYVPFFSKGIMKVIGERFFAYWLPYLLTGILMARTGFIKKFSWPVSIAMVSIVAIPIEYYLLQPTLSAYLVPSVFLVSVILVNSFLASGIGPFHSNNINRLLKTVAGNTLGIFCLNPLVVILGGYVPYPKDWYLHFAGDFIVIPLLSALLTVGICLVIISFIKKAGLGKLVSR